MAWRPTCTSPITGARATTNQSQPTTRNGSRTRDRHTAAVTSASNVSADIHCQAGIRCGCG